MWENWDLPSGTRRDVPNHRPTAIITIIITIIIVIILILIIIIIVIITRMIE